MEKRIQAQLEQMTLEEKASLCSGLNFWKLKGVERLDIPSVMMSDGPHGLRKQNDKADHLGVNESIQSRVLSGGMRDSVQLRSESFRAIGTDFGPRMPGAGCSHIAGTGCQYQTKPTVRKKF